MKEHFPKFSFDEVKSWNTSLSLPILPKTESGEVFRQFCTHPWLSRPLIQTDWMAIPNTELHGTDDKELMDFKSEDCPKGSFAVYKGESFDIWDPDRHKYYAWAPADTVNNFLFEKRKRSHARGVLGPFSSFETYQIDDIHPIGTDNLQ